MHRRLRLPGLDIAGREACAAGFVIGRPRQGQGRLLLAQLVDLVCQIAEKAQSPRSQRAISAWVDANACHQPAQSRVDPVVQPWVVRDLPEEAVLERGPELRRGRE